MSNFGLHVEIWDFLQQLLRLTTPDSFIDNQKKYMENLYVFITDSGFNHRMFR